MSVSALEVLMHQAVERIWLVPIAEDGGLTFNWCDCPSPEAGMDPAEAVEYVRADVHRAVIAKQARSAKRGMDAAKAVGSHMEAEAKRLYAECNPEALESERQANAHLTEENATLAAHVEEVRSRIKDWRNGEMGDTAAAMSLEDWRVSTPQASLARIKAQWQAQAYEELASDLALNADNARENGYMAAAETMQDAADYALTKAEVRRQAETRPFTAAREWVKSVEDDV